MLLYLYDTDLFNDNILFLESLIKPIKINQLIVSDPSYEVNVSDYRRKSTHNDSLLDIQYINDNKEDFENFNWIGFVFYMCNRVASIGIIKDFRDSDDVEKVNNKMSEWMRIMHECFHPEIDLEGLEPNKYLYPKLETDGGKLEGIGVDSSKCGFYDLEAFKCKQIEQNMKGAEVIVGDNFIISNSGYGDGIYDLYSIRSIDGDSIEGYFIDYWIRVDEESDNLEDDNSFISDMEEE